MDNFLSYDENSGFSVMGRDELESTNGGIIDWIVVATLSAIGLATTIALNPPKSSGK